MTATDSHGATVTDLFTYESANHVPAVATHAASATVLEGSTVTVTGAFADADAVDVLTLTADNASGTTFTDNGNGSWKFTYATRDNFLPVTVNISANDGEGGIAADAFNYSATNVAPVVLVSRSGDLNGCHITLTTNWTDPGLDDTFTGTVDFGDLSVTTFTGAAGVNSATFDHSYTSAGSYLLSAAVTDDDGGVGTASAVSHTVYNIPGGILQPVNDTHLGLPVSQFKLGSTVPVKIQVKDCAGASVATLAPTVKVSGDDAISTASPTTSSAMRYSADGQQYIFNLATKTFLAGHYQIQISDSSFRTPVTAELYLKK